MNVFFIINKKAITPDLSQGTILDGVTRDSAIEILKEMGYEVEERALDIDEVIDAYKAGELKEAFGTGTAATISYIKELRYKDFVMEFNTAAWTAAPSVKRQLDEIREGRTNDRFNWMYPV